jgi:hypothetical protein
MIHHFFLLDFINLQIYIFNAFAQIKVNHNHPIYYSKFLFIE